MTSPGLTVPAPVLGSTVPRLFTAPLVTGPAGPCGCGCPLTPDTSDGFDVERWAADVLGYPLRPFQRWCAIHGLELLPDGRPRFRTLLVEIGRQSGKTSLLAVLASWWQFCRAVPLTLGTSTKLDYAHESWTKACQIIEAAPALDDMRARRWRREANGEQESWSTEGARYKIAPANEEGGRSLTVHRLIMDELRQHHTYAAWGAAVNAGNDIRDFQAWAITNAGDARSVVLNELHDACEADLYRAVPADPRTGMFSWSAPADADPCDPQALAMANPNLGRTMDLDVLLGQARRAVTTGGPLLASFRTEVMCIRAAADAPALDGAAWKRAEVRADLAGTAGRRVACLDVAPDGAHASLVVAAVVQLAEPAGPREVVRVEVAATWTQLAVLRAELPGWVDRVRPYALGWFPAGPASALDAELRDRRKSGRRGWPPRGVRVVQIAAAVPAVCMGLATLVEAGGVVHSGQDVLDGQVLAAQRRTRGDGWVFDRRAGDAAHVDAVYAAAGAVHLARTVPVPRATGRLLVVPD
jgi:hypothetical protein